MRVLDTGLRGRSALITGAASGIGQSLAIGLAREGVRVFVADVRPADETIRGVREAGGRGHSMLVDLRHEEELDRVVEAAIAKFDGIDLFLNVAARYIAEAVTEVTAQSWSDIIDTNVRACVLMGKRVGRHMVERGHGSILIVGSTVVCAPSYAGATYRASKVALRSYMETLAIELAAFGIRVNMLTPGPFPTRLTEILPDDQRAAAISEVPLGQREGRLEEVQATASFLLSDNLASFITGCEVFVDGGLHLRPLFVGSSGVVRSLNSARDIR